MVNRTIFFGCNDLRNAGIEFECCNSCHEDSLDGYEMLSAESPCGNYCLEYCCARGTMKQKITKKIWVKMIKNYMESIGEGE